MAPFGVPKIVAAVAAAGSVLDVGCGSARLTLALADAGAAEVVGIDTSIERLALGRARRSAHAMGARVKLIEADFDRVLPFPDGRFGAAVSRLALMIATDPVATLRELRRVTVPGGRIVTALWAPVDDNPWFALPRAAAAAVVGADRADYARAFGRLGSPEQATEFHRAAGLADVQAETLRQTLDVRDTAGLWTWMVAENGHVRRLNAALSGAERAAVVLWRAGLRIHEALALAEADLDPRRGSLLVRRGKGGRRREVGMDDWAWEELAPWLETRVKLPVGPLFCVVNGATRGRPWAAAAARSELRRVAREAGVRRRFAPHQLRHAHAVEMAREGVPLIVIQRQLGHANLGITSVYLQGIDSTEIIDTVHARRAPMVPVHSPIAP